jgi:hypothetical protein
MGDGEAAMDMVQRICVMTAITGFVFLIAAMGLLFMTN